MCDFSVIKRQNLPFIIIADLHFVVVKERRVSVNTNITETARPQSNTNNQNNSDLFSVYRIHHSHGHNTLYRKEHCLLVLP